MKNNNMQFNEQKGEQPKFIYRKDPEDKFRYEIHCIKHGDSDYSMIGEYRVVDKSEDPEITEKRVINLINLMNGKGDVHDLSKLTNQKLLFNIVENPVKTDPTVIKLRAQNEGKGVSEEIAVLIIEKGVFYERWRDTYKSS